MSLRRRVQRMERKTGGPCRECGGRGPQQHLLAWRYGEPEPKPPRCAGCGREAEVSCRIVLHKSGESGENSFE